MSVKVLTVTQYFVKKTIFVTGGSGFIGKVLIEKLLRSTEVKNIYLLLRPKKGKNVEERLNDIVTNPLFNTLRETKPETLSKLIPLEGDITKKYLGLSNEDKQTLLNEVNIVYHFAASVKFDDFLKDAIFYNIKSTREICNLVLEMQKIDVFIHLSTAYCNIEGRHVVEEKLYSPHGDWREAIYLAENCNNEYFNVLTQKYMDKFPNSYTFTKRLAEHCVNDLLKGKVSTVICRPSIVIATQTEPVPGFIDNFNGPVGLLIAGGAGIIRISLGRSDIKPDYIPCDNLVNLIIVTTWRKSLENSKDVVSVYQASNNSTVAFTNADMIDMSLEISKAIPFEKKIWIPGTVMTTCWWWYYINVILFQLIPAFFLDIVIKLFGYQPLLVKLQRKIFAAMNALSPFLNAEWKFDNTKTMNLKTLMLKEDLISFDFTRAPAQYSQVLEYLLMACEYSRKNLLGEKGDIKPATRTTAKIIYGIDKTVKLVFFVWLIWILLFKTVAILTVMFPWLREYWKSL